jgi:TolB-like protein
MWSESYDRPKSCEIQDDIATEVAGAIGKAVD